MDNHHQPHETNSTHNGQSVVNADLYTPDFADEIDTPPEILADAAGISLAEAERVWAAILGHPVLIQQLLVRATAEWRWLVAAPIVLDVIRLLILEARNLKAKVWGLVFSSDLADVANGNESEGIGSMTDEAKRLGVSRALLSSYKRYWDEFLGRYGRVFGKTPEACANNRKARLRVLGRCPGDVTKSVALPSGIAHRTDGICFGCGQQLPEARPAA